MVVFEMDASETKRLMSVTYSTNMLLYFIPELLFLGSLFVCLFDCLFCYSARCPEAYDSHWQKLISKYISLSGLIMERQI